LANTSASLAKNGTVLILRFGHCGEQKMVSCIELRVRKLNRADWLRHTLQEGKAVRIGRDPQCDISVPWDRAISREHADLCWHEGQLTANCLPTATNAIVFRGKITRSLHARVGESFQIGETTFELVPSPTESGNPTAIEPEFIDDFGSKRAYTEQQVRGAAFGNTERQMEFLAELPTLISTSQSDEELASVLSHLLLEAIPRAEAVAVARYDVNQLPAVDAPLDHFPDPLAMRVATREGFSHRFVCSRRLLLNTLRQQSSSVYIRDTVEDMLATISEGLGWAFCCPIRGEASHGACLYVSGRGAEKGGLALKPGDLLGDLRFTELVAQFIGSVRQIRRQQENLNKIGNDLKLGRELQENFLPFSLPQPPGWEVAACFHPAREVSGDFYDVFWLSDSHLGLVIADVCNKGVGAALFMALFRTLFRTVSQQTLARELSNHQTVAGSPIGNESARGLISLLVEFNALSTVLYANQYVAETHAESAMFATTFFAVLDVSSGRLTFVNGGHEAPVVLGQNGIKHRLGLTGPVVGMSSSSSYSTQQVMLEPGDILLGYTDGVTEAHVHPGGPMFGEQRLLSLLCLPVVSATELVERIDAALTAHYAQTAPFDDITMLCVRRRPTQEQ
jgi:serine phosphatase RsbU (regulator of sigma subunit)